MAIKPRMCRRKGVSAPMLAVPPISGLRFASFVFGPGANAPRVIADDRRRLQAECSTHLVASVACWNYLGASWLEGAVWRSSGFTAALRPDAQSDVLDGWNCQRSLSVGTCMFCNRGPLRRSSFPGSSVFFSFRLGFPWAWATRGGIRVPICVA